MNPIITRLLRRAEPTRERGELLYANNRARRFTDDGCGIRKKVAYKMVNFPTRRFVLVSGSRLFAQWFPGMPLPRQVKSLPRYSLLSVPVDALFDPRTPRKVENFRTVKTVYWRCACSDSTHETSSEGWRSGKEASR